MKYIKLLLLIFFSFTFLEAQNYQIGHRQLTFVDSTRANRQITCEIYYPSEISGDNTQIALGTFPVLVFGHGFVMPASSYDIYWNTIVPKGYILVFPTTESSFSPSHTNFGKDMAHISKSMRLRGKTPSSPFYNAIDSTSAVMGHSMGGGCAFLAMQYDPEITALVSFAAAVTNPSSITAALQINKPALVFSASNDCVAPPNNHQIPMYDSLSSSCKTFISINGGDHCQFASYNFNCNLGQSTCSPKATINSSNQQSIIFNHLLNWLRYILKKDCSSGDSFQSQLAIGNGISSKQTCNYIVQKPTIVGESGICLDNTIQQYSVPKNEYCQNEWISPTKGLIVGSNKNDTVSILWKSTGIDTLKVRVKSLYNGCFVDTHMIVRIYPLPLSSITGSKNICLDNPLHSYTASFDSTISTQWQSIKKGTFQSTRDSHFVSILWSEPGIDTLKIRQILKSSGCIKDTQIIVLIHELPFTEIKGPNKVCQNTFNNIYTVENLDGHLIEWKEPKLGTIKGSKTAQSITINWKNSGNDTLHVTVKDKLTGCRFDTNLIVTIVEQPISFISGRRNVCEFTPISHYKVDPVQGCSYNWTCSPNGIILGSKNSDSVAIRWSSVGNESVMVRISNPLTGCFSDTSLSITIHPTPIPKITGKTKVIEGELKIPYSVRYDTKSTYIWNIIYGDANLIDEDKYITYMNIGKPGNIALEILEVNNYDCANTDTLFITSESMTGIQDSDNELIISPNPASESSTISIAISHDIKYAEIFNSLGETKGLYVSETHPEICISTHGLSPGVYYVILYGNQKNYFRKLLIHN